MQKKSGNKTWNIFSVVVLLLLIAAEGMLFFRIGMLHMLPDQLFWILAGAAALITGLLSLLLFRRKGGKWQRSTHGKQIVGYLIAVVGIALCFFGLIVVGQVQGTIDSITAPQKVDVVLHVYVRADDPAEFIQDTADYTFAVPLDISDEELEPILQELEEMVGRTLNTVPYPNAATQIRALAAGEVDALILNSAYLSVLEELQEFAGLEASLKLLHAKVVQKEVEPVPPIPLRPGKGQETEQEESRENTLVMYISGMDSTHSIHAVGRSDVNILAVVNLDTHQVLLVNTPRDYYVVNPASGNDSMDKLTHCGLNGVDNSMAALAQLYGVSIEHYAKINFTGFETLIDAIGGVTVYSDVAFTAVGGHYIRKGENFLNGEQALGFARTRKALAGGDNDRGKNQMKVITAIVNQLSASNLLSNYSQILESMEGTFTTSMSGEEIGRLVQLQLSQMPNWDVHSFAVTGKGGTDLCWAAGWHAYVMYPHEHVVEQASQLIEKVLDGDILTQEDLTIQK